VGVSPRSQLPGDPKKAAVPPMSGPRCLAVDGELYRCRNRTDGLSAYCAEHMPSGKRSSNFTWLHALGMLAVLGLTIWVNHCSG
jgi:hypothetical protein